jgi:hypothetical protein
VIQEEVKTGKNYVSTGRDRLGRPILYAFSLLDLILEYGDGLMSHVRIFIAFVSGT